MTRNFLMSMTLFTVTTVAIMYFALFVVFPAMDKWMDNQMRHYDTVHIQNFGFNK